MGPTARKREIREGGLLLLLLLKTEDGQKQFRQGLTPARGTTAAAGEGKNGPEEGRRPAGW